MRTRRCRGTRRGRRTDSGGDANDRAGNADLWKQHLGDPDPIRLTSSEADESQPRVARWPSHRFPLRARGRGLYDIPANGGVQRLVSASATSRAGHRMER